MKVWLAIKSKATFKRKYETIDVGDNVRVAIKKTSFTKGHDPKFTPTTYKIIAKQKLEDGTDAYCVHHPTCSKLFHRWEMKLANTAEDKHTI
eukprot:4601550-Heterocapsa_arctica.AAC.1